MTYPPAALRIPGLTHQPSGTLKRTLSPEDFEDHSTPEERALGEHLAKIASSMTPEQARELQKLQLDAEYLGLYSYRIHPDGFIERIDPEFVRFDGNEYTLHTPEGPELITPPAGPRFVSVLAI